MSRNVDNFTHLFEAVHSDQRDGSIYLNPTGKEIGEAYRFSQETDGYMRGTMLCNVIKGDWCFTNIDMTHQTLAREVGWRYDDCVSFYLRPDQKHLSFSYSEYNASRNHGKGYYFDPTLFEQDKYFGWLISSGWTLKNADERPKEDEEQRKKRQRAMDRILQSDRELLDKLMGESSVELFICLFDS